MKKDIRERMKEGRLYFDGGTGTCLQEQGLPVGQGSEVWNLEHPEKIVALQRDYLLAGADIIKANTFGANPLRYENYEDVVTAAMKIAGEALRQAGRTDDAYIALDLGPTGRMLEPLGDYPYEEAISLYKAVIAAALKSPVSPDIILIETMNDSIETKAAVLAAKESCDLPIFVTNVYDEHGALMTGATPEAMVAMLEGLRVDALGMNCSLGPAQIVDIVPRFAAVSSTPIIVNPNAGLPRPVDGKTVYDVGPDDFAAYMKTIVSSGATLVGGCCGTTPDYIRKVVAATKDLPYSLPSEKNISVVSSFTHAVSFGERTVLIGERINPTGKKRFKQALVDHDINYILEEGLQEQKAGADVLDVNVGLPEIDEPALMEEVVSELQALCDLPLQIDTGDAVAMEKALRIYNGKPMINSVNGKKEVQNAVFPLAAKYGGLVVGLTIDEDGVAQTAEKRVSIAKQIYAEAAKYGIKKKDIIIDPLAMTVSADDQSGAVTLEAVRRIHDELGGLTSLGVSNVSFGLPGRGALNGTFFTMAMQCGLSAAIMNPFSEDMMKAYYTFNALAGRDSMCMSYLSYAKEAEEQAAEEKQKLANSVASAAAAAVKGFGTGMAPASPAQAVSAGPAVTAAASSAGPAAPVPASSAGPVSAGAGTFGGLQEAIVAGLRDKAKAESETLISGGAEPLALVNEAVIPALNVVGDGFEKKSLFLPNLLMAAEAAQAAFGVIREAMAKTATGEKKPGKKIVIATVHGDVHDIGKNIVKVILENYGFDVIDLGKDVPPEKIVETTLSEGAKLVGLSALMTTTVPAMEETIRQLHEKAPGVKIMVGGAVMNPDYAAMIKADFYGKDAMASVRYAEEVLA